MSLIAKAIRDLRELRRRVNGLARVQRMLLRLHGIDPHTLETHKPVPHVSEREHEDGALDGTEEEAVIRRDPDMGSMT